MYYQSISYKYVIQEQS